MNRRTLWLAFAASMAIACALYANTFGNAWTMDDFPVIVNNPDVQSWSGFWQNTYPGRPLRELSFLLDHALFGMNPWGYHFQQLFWHGFNGFLVFLLISRLSSHRAVAWLSSLLFLVHPVQVEVVANISHRKDSLMLACGLLALLAYQRAFASHSRKWAWVAAAWFLVGLACLGKQNAAVLPLMFAAYELVDVRQRQERILLRLPWLVPLGLIACAGGLIYWVHAVGGWPALQRQMHLSLVVHANYLQPPELLTWYAMVLKSWVVLFLKLFVPVNLAVEYVYPVPASLLDPWVIAALLSLLGYVAALYFCWRRSALCFFALVWSAVFFLPVANLLPLSYFAADRYLYVPSVGVFILVALLLERLFRGRRLALLLVVLVLVGALAGLSWRQNRVWNSNFSLYSRAVEVNPQSAFALSNLGWAYYQRMQVWRAIDHLQKATQVNPYLPVPLYNLATIYERLGSREKALAYFTAALRCSDNMPGFFEPTALKIKTILRTRYGINPGSGSRSTGFAPPLR